MKGLMVLLGGVGLGAAIMYMLDPDRGNRRRALLRDKVTKVNRQTQQAVSGKVHDMTNRAKGMLHEAKSAFGREESVQEQPSTF